MNTDRPVPNCRCHTGFHFIGPKRPPVAHDYEPGEVTHPMDTDPRCRICGGSKRDHD